MWIILDLPFGSFVGFTYVDTVAGLSAQAYKFAGTELVSSSRVIVRLPPPGSWRLAEADLVRRLGLSSPPEWVENYGPQPAPGTPWHAWREHPLLAGRFLAEFPDDLQVIVHDGGPRRSSKASEAVWVTVTGVDADAFRGRVLNQPHQLETVRQGSEIRFIVADGAPHPIMVTEQYLTERPAWVIHPCRQCGFSELFDAPSDLIRATFPDAPAEMEISMFTAFCPLCGGVQGVESRVHPPPTDEEPDRSANPTRRPWWRPWGDRRDRTR
jgi:hypothetical protein